MSAVSQKIGHQFSSRDLHFAFPRWRDEGPLWTQGLALLFLSPATNILKKYASLEIKESNFLHKFVVYTICVARYRVKALLIPKSLWKILKILFLYYIFAPLAKIEETFSQQSFLFSSILLMISSVRVNTLGHTLGCHKCILYLFWAASTKILGMH